MPQLAPMDAEILGRIFQALALRDVRYVVFGGIAVNARGVTRTTEDLDLFLHPAPGNVEAARRALQDVFADPDLEELTHEALEEYGLIRYGPPTHNFVIDLTTRIGEVFAFDDIEQTPLELFGHQVPIATARMLVRMKRESVRDKDRSDAARLRERWDIEDL